MTARSCDTISRREARRQDRREAILTVAKRYFLEHGYSATTMSAIAAKRGGSKGTLWNYFPSKEALFTAVIDQATIEFRKQLSEVLDPCGDIALTLSRFCHKLLEKITSPDGIALSRLVIAEAGRFPEVGRIFYDRAPKQTVALLADFLSGAMERGQIRSDDPSNCAQFLMHLCVSRCQQQLWLRLTDTLGPDDIAAEVERTMDLFMRTYAVHKPAPERELS
ncbi:TetR family transcriptional regulator [Croceicoccus estronivorus]|uniref:TetR/AcrR family transcriptional regulator n=1 Tax=Croceicoccus estronivorus TaxID=1172626 RepID=UPI000836C433|nr:TetR/AcrR family transcriptional regulator [Croceicoccus estronivorus]OCC22407.1 TetR family transcriptional regulator [Croceicoccus estronivorus]